MWIKIIIFVLDLKKLISYETRYSLQSPNVNAVESHNFLTKNKIQDHFEKLYSTTTEATKARISARLKQADRENDDPYDPYKFDRRRVDEEISECPQKQIKLGTRMQNQQKRTNQNTEPSKSVDNGMYIGFYIYVFCFSSVNVNEESVFISKNSFVVFSVQSTIFGFSNTSAAMSRVQLSDTNGNGI